MSKIRNDYFDNILVSNCYNWSQKAMNKLTTSKGDRKNLYHYTSTKVLNTLLDKGTFWASHLFFLNDSKEYEGGIEFLNKIFNDSQDSKPNLILEDIKIMSPGIWSGIYSISFSEKEDSLHQWITYSKEGGISIELEFHPKLLLLLAKEERENNSIKISHYFEKVYNSIYYYQSSDNSSSSFKDFRNYILDPIKEGCLDDEAREDALKIYFQLLSSYFKEIGFKEEGEIRLPFFASQQTGPSIRGKKPKVIETKIEYFEMPEGILRPYLKVKFCKEEDVEKAKTFEEVKASLPLKSITIGPSGKQQRVFDGIVHRVKFGSMNIYECEGTDLYNRFNSYVDGAIKRLVEENQYYSNNLDSLKENIKAALYLQWKKEMNEQEQEESKSLQYLGLNDSFIKETKELIESSSSSEEAKKLKQIIQLINKNNYFSKEGIWIKKSKIPYIF